MNTPTKRCTKCGNDLPASDEFFYSRNGKLISRCKACIKANVKHYASEHPEQCREYKRTSAKRWRQSNPEAAREKDKQDRIKHRERRLENNREWLKRNAIRRQEYSREYRRTHPYVSNETRRAQQRAYAKRRYYDDPAMARKKAREWHKAHAKQNNERSRNYRKMHPESKRICEAKRRAQKLSSVGNYSVRDMQRQYKNQKGKCYYCQKSLGDTYQIEHVIPLSRGGSHESCNIVIACPNCNQSKHNKLPHEWPEGGRLL